MVSVSLFNNVLPFVTARGETGNDLEQRDEIIRLLIDSTGEGIYGTDMDGVCPFANPACAGLIGFDSEQDLLGKNTHELVHHTQSSGDPYPMSECQIYRAFREQVGVHVDDELMFCANGTSFPAKYWSYPVTRDDELVGCVRAFVDITECKRIEAELASQHCELEIEKAKSEVLLLLQLCKNGKSEVIPASMSANLCTEVHRRELTEQGFEVAVVADATAAAQHPELGDGCQAALTNFRYIASAVVITDVVVGSLA